MTTQELKEYINKTLGNSIRCMLPSYWWKRIFGLIVDKVAEVDNKVAEVPTKQYIDNVVKGKQDTLVSGTNIKTINGESVLGEGNIEIKTQKIELYINNTNIEQLPNYLIEHNLAVIQNLKSIIPSDYVLNYIIDNNGNYLSYDIDYISSDFDGGCFVYYHRYLLITNEKEEFTLHFKSDGSIERLDFIDVPKIFATGKNGNVLTEAELQQNIQAYNLILSRINSSSYYKLIINGVYILTYNSYRYCKYVAIIQNAVIFELNLTYNNVLEEALFTLYSDGHVEYSTKQYQLLSTNDLLSYVIVTTNQDCNATLYGLNNSRLGSVEIRANIPTTLRCTNFNILTEGAVKNIKLRNFDTRYSTSFEGLFGTNSSFKNVTELDVSNFDTSNVTDMSSMFNNCSKLETLDLSSFDTSNVTKMGYMFSGCRTLTTLDLSSFDTSKVTDMGFTFQGCSSLTTIILGENFFKTSISSLSFNQCSKWTNDSVITSLVTNSYDRIANGLSTINIVLSNETKAVLTEEHIATMAAKGYIV